MGVVANESLLKRTLDMYNLEFHEAFDYRSDFRKFEVVGESERFDVFVSISFGLGDARMIAEDLAIAKLGNDRFDVMDVDGLIRDVIDVSLFTSLNEDIDELSCYYII